jgi:hypothetical protein
MDEWFFNPIIHGILQNLIHMLTRHPWPHLPKDETIMENKSTQVQTK